MARRNRSAIPTDKAVAESESAVEQTITVAMPKAPDPDKAFNSIKKTLSGFSPEWRHKLLSVLCIWHDLHRDVQLTFREAKMDTAADGGIELPLQRPVVAAQSEETAAEVDPFAELDIEIVSKGLES